MNKVRLLLGAVFSLSLGFLCSSQGAVSITTSAGLFPLVSGGQAAPIFTSDGDHKVVEIASGCLADDIAAVTGVRPVVTKGAPAGARAIVIGTIGKSTAIDSLVSSGKLDVASVVGKWESFVIQIVDNPFPGIAEGSGDRGKRPARDGVRRLQCVRGHGCVAVDLVGGCRARDEGSSFG